MEEKDIPVDNTPDHIQTKRNDTKKNGSNQQETRVNSTPDTKTYDSKEISNTARNTDNKDGLQKENKSRNIDTNESGKVTGRDTILKRFHKLSQKEHSQGRKRPIDNIFTIIVIGYTILILLLGFLVYRDIAKRLNSIENRVSNIEANITGKSNLTFDNLEIYDKQ